MQRKKTIELDFTDNPEIMTFLGQVVKDANNKNIGEKVTMEDAITYLVDSFLRPQVEKCVFDLQKNSISEEILDSILKNQFTQ